MELSIRVQAYMNWLFGFDLKRVKEITIEVTEEMKLMRPGDTDWDHMDGNEFTDIASRALRTVRGENPWLFL